MSACRVCSILKGEPVKHDPSTLHSNAPSRPTLREQIDQIAKRVARRS